MRNQNNIVLMSRRIFLDHSGTPTKTHTTELGDTPSVYCSLPAHLLCRCEHMMVELAKSDPKWASLKQAFFVFDPGTVSGCKKAVGASHNVVFEGFLTFLKQKKTFLC